MNKLFLQSAILLAFSVLVFSSCKKSKTDDSVLPTQKEEPKNEVVTSNFTRKAMLINLADNLISPSLASFSNQADSLYNTVLSFTEAPTPAMLDSLQSRLDKTVLAWQYCGWFRFGTARTQFGAVDGSKKFDQINTFPISTTKTEAYILAADYSLANTNYDTKGLGVIDYLINPSDGKDSVVLANFAQSENRKAYLLSLAFAIKTRANTVKNAWASEKVDYVAASGTDGESSSSFTALDMDIDFDNIKNGKVGIPVGRTVAGIELLPFPEKTEAFYGGQSVKYLRANIKAIENLWRGRSIAGVDSLGFDDYLNSVNATNVSQGTINQFNAIYAKLDAVPEGRLSDIIKTNKEPVRELYAELQKLTNYMKTDMISALGLSITYASGDGD